MRYFLIFLAGFLLAIASMLGIVFALHGLGLRAFERDFSAFFIVLVLGIISWVKIKKGPFKGGLLTSLIISLCFLMIVISSELIDELKPNTKFVERPERSEFQKKDDTFKNIKIPLKRKFEEIRLGKLSDSVVVVFSFEELESQGNSLEINSLRFPIEQFTSISKQVSDNNTNHPKIVKDSIRFFTTAGQMISKKLSKPSGSDSTVYLGFLPKNNVHIIVESASEFGPDYFSINNKNGDEFRGIPFINSPDNQYSAFVHFKHEIGDLELVIYIWSINQQNGDFLLIHEETIPLGYSISDKNQVPFSLSDFIWTNKNVLSFRFSDLRREGEFVRVKIKVANI